MATILNTNCLKTSKDRKKDVSLVVLTSNFCGYFQLMHGFRLFHMLLLDLRSAALAKGSTSLDRAEPWNVGRLDDEHTWPST